MNCPVTGRINVIAQRRRPRPLGRAGNEAKASAPKNAAARLLKAEGLNAKQVERLLKGAGVMLSNLQAGNVNNSTPKASDAPPASTAPLPTTQGTPVTLNMLQAQLEAL